MSHKGGTKDYFLTLVVNAQGRAIVIRRWGAKGATGQVRVKKFASQLEAEVDYQKELDHRQSGSKGYRITDSKTLQIEKREAFPFVVGRTVFPKIGPANVQHLDPTYDTTGMREPESNRDDDDNFIGNATRHVTIDPDVVARAEAARKEAELAEMKQNPKFGRF
ncbi:WGR domain-containing protein [Shinella zoogloeoides]|uniref:WGR domain-containing protein n=1 Tax=Shinella zoogloeoides TaxID=352475 RepID=UPI00273E98B8|nr:WGR domain-containing protein [Shinella zoogloeoides]WLR91029.1 WGR domain-containing protein [Shinella zoogloeoides]